ncbi:MAG: signal peptidase I [Firmicutes bacterium]|nr:signal peptidase I [Bacillota bacterium]
MWRELAETVGGAIILALFIMAFVARAFTVDGPSMLPTLHTGEKLLIDKLTYRFRPPERGEVIVFKYPANPREHFIKRVIGIPGDVVSINSGDVYINGKKLDEDYLTEKGRGDLPALKIPENSVFVLGDNRTNSHDSRSRLVGFVPMKLVEGRAIWRYWPLTSIHIVELPKTFAQFNKQ